ncbi:MAG: hypothetical protein KDA22_04575 [Phycisphaerales bacterium]|nr:hypothetical protein [Phycisphaerales bacterium]
MQNKFGLKDFVFLVLLLAVGVSVWLSMYQSDQHWTRMRSMESSIAELERHLARVEDKLEQGVQVSQAAATTSAAPVARDASWARAGVPIQWQEPWTFSSDPRKQPKFAPGGTFTEIFEAQPPKLVPFLSTDVYGRRVIDRVAEPLGAYDPETLAFRGVLADAWQLDPEGKWIRVHIDPRARFSDSVPVTAEDVRWTFKEYIQNPLIEAERARSTLDQVKDVKVVDDRTVEFEFSEPLFTNLDYTLGTYILPKHYYSRFEPAAINKSTGLLMGSGPFKIASLDPERQWAPGEDLTIVRNEQYWGDKPVLDALRFKVVNDDLARLTAYEAGEGDMILPSSVQFQRKAKDPVWSSENQMLKWINMRSSYAFIAWQCGPRNGKLTPFHDKRVRQAMTLALDRERMVRDIWEGLGEVATGPNNSQSPANNPAIKPWPYDLERAKALLAEAGWKPDEQGILRNADGEAFEFEFTRSSGGEVVERTSTYIKDQCAKLGIKCNVRIVDWSVYSQILKTRDFDALIMSWSASAPESDPKQIFHSDSIADQGDNFIQWSNPEADRLIDAGRRELDTAKRQRIWHELHAVMHEEQPYTFVIDAPWKRIVRKRIGNVQMHRSGLEPWEFFVIPGAAATATSG